MSAAADAFEPNAEQIVAANQAFADAFGDADLAGKPARRVAIVTCMDARLDVLPMLGLANGDAHVIRNAGGVVTDDVIRSLCLSQRALGTREVLVIHHTRCGVQTVTEDAFKAELESELGVKPAWSVEAFTDVHDDVRQSIRRLELSPFLLHKDHIRGFVYDVDSGRIEAV